MQGLSDSFGDLALNPEDVSQLAIIGLAVTFRHNYRARAREAVSDNFGQKNCVNLRDFGKSVD